MRTTLTYPFEIPRSKALDTEDLADEVNRQVDEFRAKVSERWTIHNETIVSHGVSLTSSELKFSYEVRVEPKVAPNHCHNCGQEIKIAIFRGGEWCSDDCRKELGKDIV